MALDPRQIESRGMKKTAPHVQPILQALLSGKPITAEEVNTVLRDGKQSDLELAMVMSSRRPYGPVLYNAAMSAYKDSDCEHDPRETPLGNVCVKCSAIVN